MAIRLVDTSARLPYVQVAVVGTARTA